MFPLILAMFDSMVQKLRKTCLRLPLTQRSLSLDENLRAKEGGKEKTVKTSLLLSSFTFPWSLGLRHMSLAFRGRLCAKNEAPKEEAVCATLFRETAHLPHSCNPFFTLYLGQRGQNTGKERVGPPGPPGSPGPTGLRGPSGPKSTQWNILS